MFCWSILEKMYPNNPRELQRSTDPMGSDITFSEKLILSPNATKSGDASSWLAYFSISTCFLTTGERILCITLYCLQPLQLELFAFTIIVYIHPVYQEAVRQLCAMPSTILLVTSVYHAIDRTAMSDTIRLLLICRKTNNRWLCLRIKPAVQFHVLPLVEGFFGVFGHVYVGQVECSALYAPWELYENANSQTRRTVSLLSVIFWTDQSESGLWKDSRVW